MRLVVLAKFVRYSRAIHLLVGVVHARRFELSFTALVGSTVVLFAASVLYVLEGELQPDAFGSIPRAMWWAVDVYPLTPLGRLFGSLTAFAGIGLIAMPTGVLAAALSDALSRARELHRAAAGDASPNEADADR